MEHETPLLQIVAHWPHDRFGLAYSFLPETDEVDYWSIELILGCFTIIYNNI